MPRRKPLNGQDVLEIIALMPKPRKTGAELQREFHQDMEDVVYRLWSLMNKVSDEVLEEILRNRLDRDRTVSAVALKYGASDGCIDLIWKKASKGLTKEEDHLRNFLTEADRSNLRDWVNMGTPNEEIGRRLGAVQRVVDEAVEAHRNDLLEYARIGRELIAKEKTRRRRSEDS